MKFTKKVTITHEVLVETKKAPKGKHWEMPIMHLERWGNSRTEIFKYPHYFNDEGCVCAHLSVFYNVVSDGMFYGSFIDKKKAVKLAKSLIKDIA